MKVGTYEASSTKTKEGLNACYYLDWVWKASKASGLLLYILY